MADCPDCGAAPGEWHHIGCDVARCQNRHHTCHQLISTPCEGKPVARDWWDGTWPGDTQARQLGLTETHGQHTIPDLNRLIMKYPNAMRARSTPRPER